MLFSIAKGPVYGLCVPRKYQRPRGKAHHVPPLAALEKLCIALYFLQARLWFWESDITTAAI